MNLKYLLITAAIPSGLLLSTGVAWAQTTLDTDQTTPIITSTAGDNGAPDDVLIGTATASITVNVASGTAVTIDSDNDVTNNGTIIIEDADNAIGVDLQGGNSGDFTNAGAIQLTEDFTNTDTDGDNVVDGPFAQGTGRTGILISGASPFVGNVNQNSGSSITVEGNDSYGIRLLQSAGLTGRILNNGNINILGNNSHGISLEGQTVGNVTNVGSIAARGEGSSAIVVSGDITGQLNNSGILSATGYRFTDRLSLAGRNLLGTEDLLQGGPVIQVNGNVSNGVFLQEVRTSATTDGVTTETVTSRSNVSQMGGAPAILIDGQGTPISIGIVATITDPMDGDFDAEEQYAFVNQGLLTANATYDDINATVFELRDATLTDGFNNSGSLTATAFRSGDDGTADAAGATGLARVIVLGDGAIADRINNSGLIIAQVSEATDEVYADRANVVAARDLQAIAIDIGANATVANLTNSRNITALISGRTGQAVAIRDASGTLTFLENSGSISALGTTSDAQGNEATSFDLIALDLTANTTGVTINQVAAIDDDPTDDLVPVDPAISGDILLGSGADTLNVEKGVVVGALAFGNGADTFMLSGGSTYAGAISDSDGMLTIGVSGGSTLTNTGSTALNITDATFDDTSVFRPTLDGATGQASGLNATGDITLADGATISPILNNVISTTSSTFTVFDAGGTLAIAGDLDSLLGFDSPFLYDTSFAIDPNDPNALIVTLDLRSTGDLGLDSVQTASFNSAFEALQSNTDLANAFINITDGNEFNSAFSQLLPEFAAAARQFVVANVDGAVGAVGTHLDNARKSQDKPGGVWLEEFAYFADRDLAGLAQQYRGYGFGITGGLDTTFGPFHTVGVNVGFASTEIEDVVGVDEPLDVLTLQLGGYAGYATGALGVEAYAGFGYNDFEATRNVEVGSFSATSDGDWKGTHYNASLRAGYDVAVSEKFWARPAVSIDYLKLSEDAYTESGPTGVALDVEKRSSTLGGATAMLNFGANFEGRRTWLRPSVRVGYRNEFINDGLVTNYGFVGLNNRASLTAAEFPDSGVLVGFSLAAGSEYSSFGLDFDSDIRDGFIRHTGRIVIRLIF